MINNTATTNVGYGFLFDWNVYNTTLINNTATKNDEGISVFLISQNFYNTTLINNWVTNNDYGIDISNCFNTVLLNNKAINNGFGFYLENAHNTILKNNIGIFNYNADYAEYNSTNTLFLNNTFVFINNKGLGQYFSTTLFTNENIIAVIILIGIYVAIGYRYSTSKKKEQVLIQQTRIDKRPRSASIPFERLGVFLGLFDPLIVIICIFYYPYITFTHDIILNADIFQLSPLSGLLLLGGGIEMFGNLLIYIRATSFNGCNIAEHNSLIGFITQTISAVLALLAYTDVVNSINEATNAIKSISGLYQYIISPINAPFLSFLVIILGLITYYSQRTIYRTIGMTYIENIQL